MKRQPPEITECKIAHYYSAEQRDNTPNFPLPNEKVIGFNDVTKNFEVYNGVRWEKLGPSRPIYEGNPLRSFAITSDYKPKSGYGQFSRDYEHTFTGECSLKGGNNTTTVTNAIIAESTLATAINLEGKYLMFRYWVSTTFDGNQLSVSIGSSTSDYITYPRTAAAINKGWNVTPLLLVPTDFTSGIGTCASTVINFLRVAMSAAGGSTGIHGLTYDLYTVYDSHDPGIIVLTFDDAKEWQYTTALSILTANEFKATFYIPPKILGGSTYLDIQQVRALYNAGHSIGSHSYDHSSNLLNEDATTVRQNLYDAREWLLKNGFGEGAYHLAWPYTYHNETVRKIAAELCHTARGGGGLSYAPCSPEFDMNFQLPGKNGDTLNSTDFEAYVNIIVASKGMSVLYFHEKTSSDFAVNIAYLRTKVNSRDLLVMDIVEYYKYITKKFNGNWYTNQNSTYY